MQVVRDNTLQGKFNRLRSNKAFELFVIGIIIFSALVIGAKTYDIPPLLSQAIVVADWFITLFFLVEITIRFLGEPNKPSFFKSGWNIFDTLIVIVSLVPIENSEMALIGRLVRVFRVLRMVSIIPELRILISSLLKAMPQLGYVGTSDVYHFLYLWCDRKLFLLVHQRSALGGYCHQYAHPVPGDDL